VVAWLLVASPLFFATLAQGQRYTFAASGLLGFGGSVDESDAGYGNLNWQLGFSNNIEERTHFGVRLGGIEWGSGDRVGEVVAPSLLYLTLAGEYRETSGSFSGGFIESGVFIGLGFYRLEGTESDPEARSVDENGIGLALGLTGDLPLNSSRSLALRIELSAHYADLDAAQFFALGQVGLSYRF
jgi:hypothetical protein